MDLEQFASDLHNEILALCTEEDFDYRQEKFTEYVISTLLEHNEADQSAETCYWAALAWGKLPRAQVDAWGLSPDGATLDLFISKYHGSGVHEFVSQQDVSTHFKMLMGFLKRAWAGVHLVEESHPVFEAMKGIFEAKGDITTVRMFFLTDGEVKSTGRIEDEKLGDVDVRYVYWDLDKLSRLRVGERQVISLDFEKDFGTSISALVTDVSAGGYQTYLACLPASILAGIYDQYGQKLLERNVRAFLQVKNKVNKGLQQTIRDEPARFLAYNNGLCCTASSVASVPVSDGMVKLLAADDFQIVNGGQTTASLHHAMKKEKADLGGVFVQMKLTVIREPDLLNEMVPRISRYANSQSKVNTADFSANGPFHQKLESRSRLMWAPPVGGLEKGTLWYYERARGSYMDEKSRSGTPTEKKIWERDHPVQQKFTKTDLAKFENAWDGRPHLVCLGAEKNFTYWAQGLEENGYPDVTDDYFRRIVARAILWKTAEKRFSEMGLPQYRAPSVAYAIAWMSCSSGKRINLDLVWKKQELPPELDAVLPVVLKRAHEHITHAEGNAGEKAKKKEFWEEFKGTPIDLGDAWKSSWADHPFIDVSTEADMLVARWNDLRRHFLDDRRTFAQIEEAVGRGWIRSRAMERVSAYASLEWPMLMAMPGIGKTRATDLITFLAVASAQLNHD